jgi:molybdate transport system substrate-binding protein
MAIQLIRSALAQLALAAMIIGANRAHADEIKVISSAAVREAYLELVPSFEKSSGHKVTTIWDGTENIIKRINGGEVVDIVILSAPTIDKFIADGKMLAGSRTDIVKSGIGIAVRSGLPKPDISSTEAVKKAMLAANSIAYSTGPSGIYIAELVKKLGIADQVKEKMKQTKSGVPVGEVLARGEADIGFQQVSELLHVKGIQYLGPLPPDIQTITVYSAGLHNAAAAPDAAKSLVKFLLSPEAAPAIRKMGMEPG